MKHVSVRFSFHGPHYTYRTDFDCEAGDKVVVHNRDSNITSIATVVDMHEDGEYEEQSGILYTWIVQRVDFSQYLEHVGTLTDSPIVKGRL